MTKLPSIALCVSLAAITTLAHAMYSSDVPGCADRTEGAPRLAMGPAAADPSFTLDSPSSRAGSRQGGSERNPDTSQGTNVASLSFHAPKFS